MQTLAEQGLNFDVASYGELQQVLAQGVSAEQVLNTGPAKSKQQIAEFIDAGVRIFVVESINQLQWLNDIACQKEQGVKALLRVQLQWPEGDKNPLGGNELTPFGLGVEQWKTIQLSDFQSVNVCGLHIFQWGNMLSNEKMYSLWSQMVPPLVALAKQLPFELEILDLGGGFGIDYLQSGQQLSWQQIIADLSKIKAEAGVKELWLELGRFAVAECGVYLSPVVDRKQNFQQQQIVLAGGINHLLRPAITDQPFPAQLLRQSDAATTHYDVHGPLCTSMDKLGQFELADDIDENDTLVFSLCGAYGFTESMPFFLCHSIAAEWVYSQGEFEIIREAAPATWYLR